MQLHMFRLHRLWSKFLAIMLLALLLIGSTQQRASARPVLQTEDEQPSEVILADDYRITFLGVEYDSAADTSTWGYHVEELPDATSLGYWILELPYCITVTSATPESWVVVRPDPNTQVAGIKWEVGGDFVEGDFSLTVQSIWNVGETTVAAKGGSDEAYGTIAGPSCDQNRVPVGVDDEVSTYQDTQVSIPVLQNDTEEDGEPLLLMDFDETSVEGGTVTRVDNGTPGEFSDDYLTYTPPGGFTGQDSFTYTISDGVLTDQATVVVQVQTQSEAPIAVPDTYIVLESPYQVSPPGLLLNDQLLENDDVQIVLQDPPNFGFVTIGTDGSFTYTPNASFYGEDSFTYYLETGFTTSNTTTVTLQVPDEEEPTVTWTAPVLEGEIQYVREGDEIQLQVDAEDNNSIDRVLFFRWDAISEEYITITEDFDAPFTEEISVSELQSGFNQIFVTVYDSFENRSETKFIWLYKVGDYWLYLPITSK